MVTVTTQLVYAPAKLIVDELEFGYWCGKGIPLVDYIASPSFTIAMTGILKRRLVKSKSIDFSQQIRASNTLLDHAEFAHPYAQVAPDSRIYDFIRFAVENQAIELALTIATKLVNDYQHDTKETATKKRKMDDTVSMSLSWTEWSEYLKNNGGNWLVQCVNSPASDLNDVIKSKYMTTYTGPGEPHVVYNTKCTLADHQKYAHKLAENLIQVHRAAEEYTNYADIMHYALYIELVKRCVSIWDSVCVSEVQDTIDHYTPAN